MKISVNCAAEDNNEKLMSQLFKQAKQICDYFRSNNNNLNRRQQELLDDLSDAVDSGSTVGVREAIENMKYNSKNLKSKQYELIMDLYDAFNLANGKFRTLGRNYGVNASTRANRRAIKASDESSKKYRIDIYKANNPDYLMKREYKMFNSEEDAVEYGTSIANGNEVVVNQVKSSTRSSRSSIMAATDEYMLSEVIGEKDAIIDEWRNTYDGNPSTSWDEIFDNVVNDFELYCDDEASSYGEDRTLKEKFDAGELSESDMLTEFYDYIRFIDISDYDN